MSSTVSVGGFEVTSNNETASEMATALAPAKSDTAGPVVLVDGGKEVDPEKAEASAAAAKLGKKGGEAAAAKRAAEAKAAEPAPAKEEKAEPAPEKPAEEKPLGHPRDDPRARAIQATQQLAAERAEKARLAQENADFRARLARLENGGETPQRDPRQPTERQAASGKPKEEDFESYADYVDAVTDWKVDQKLQERERHASLQRQAHEHAQKAAASVQTFTKRMADAVQADPSFWSKLDPRVDQLLQGARPSYDVPPGERPDQLNAVVDELIQSERPHELMIYFSENIEEFSRILSAPSRSAIARAVALIEGRLAGSGTTVPAQKPEVSRAKPPVKPVTASAQAGEADIFGEMSFDEFAARRKAKRA